MKILKTIIICLFMTAALVAFAVAAGGTSDKPIALKGATVHTAVGAPIENAVILIENGKITAIGSGVAIPSGIKVLDLAGKVVIPGMIDAYSQLGISVDGDAAEAAQPIGPENRAMDSLHLDIPDWREAVKAGVTTVVTGPGFETRIGGQSVTLKTCGCDLSRRILRESGDVTLSLKGVNLSHLSTLEAQFLKAREYLGKFEKYEAGDKKGPAPEKDPGLEPLARAIKGETLIRANVIWAHDIMALLELKDEFGFPLQLVDATEAWKVAGEIARRGVDVVCLPMTLTVNVPEDVFFGVAALRKAGVRIAMHSNYPASPIKWFRLNGSMAVHYGLSHDDALKALTIDAARMAGIDGRVGSLEKGKDADLVVLNGPWQEAVSRIETVFVNGVPVFDRAANEKPAAEGK